jgi:hypothetical protein
MPTIFSGKRQQIPEDPSSVDRPMPMPTISRP